MKRVLFLLSHVCSGSHVLYASLDSNPRIQGYRGDYPNVYEGRMDLFSLVSQPHKLDNASAIYMDELLYNSSIQDRSIYPECKYIFVLRDPRDALNEMVATKNYNPRKAVDYYRFRLRRLHEIARKAPDSVLLTFADLESRRGSSVVSSYLNLPDPLDIPAVCGMGLENKLPLSLVEEATYAFEKYLYRMKSLGLSVPSPEAE